MTPVLLNNVDEGSSLSVGTKQKRVYDVIITIPGNLANKSFGISCEGCYYHYIYVIITLTVNTTIIITIITIITMTIIILVVIIVIIIIIIIIDCIICCYY